MFGISCISTKDITQGIMTIVPNIFKIDLTHNALRKLTDTSAIIRTIISRSWKKRDKVIDIETLNDISSFKKGDISYYLYYYQVADKESDWFKFLPNELRGTGEFKQTKVNLVLFIETENELFAIIGGSAYWLIANYIDHLYGLLTYDRIISLEEDEATSTKSRGMTGQRAGLSEQFRNEYRMINYLQFGKVPKELHIKLANQTSLDHFSFLLSKESERLQITVGKGFRINKEVAFDKLHLVIEELNTILSLAPKDFISSYIHIQDRIVIEELNYRLIEKIYNNIPYLFGASDDPRDIFEFDFCNPNKIEEFYEAEHYDLVEYTESGKKKEGLFATVRDKQEIYKVVIERAYSLYGDNMNAIKSYLYGVTVQCYVGNRKTASSGFMYHFNSELSYKGDAVFLIDSKWYRLKGSFVEGLIFQTERVLKTSRLQEGVIDKLWIFDTEKKKFTREGLYNMQYNNRPNYIVVDTVIVDGVELCDILHFTKNEIYLIHVKHSFTAKVRELTNQILISARCLTQAVSGKDRVYFDKLFDALIDKGRYVNGFDKDQFYNVFLTRKPIYVFATASQLALDLPIESNVEQYDSNIARFSLVTCASEMQNSYYEFKTWQISRA